MTHVSCNICPFVFRSVGMIATSVAAIAFAWMALAAPAAAQNNWTMSISEKEMKLENPLDMMWDKWLMWDIGYQRMMCRNMPYIELRNEASSSSPITEFHLTIGDNRFNFGPFEGGSLAQLGSTTPGFSLLSSTLNGGDEIVVSIGNGGLLPGQLVRFQINLDVDPAFAAQYAATFGATQPDFRTVLFDMNGHNVYDGFVHGDSADNAHAFVTFTPGGDSSEDVFQDEAVAAGTYYNSHFRPYRDSDPVLIFQLQGAVEVPEPATVGSLMMLGITAMMMVRRRCR